MHDFFSVCKLGGGGLAPPPPPNSKKLTTLLTAAAAATTTTTTTTTTQGRRSIFRMGVQQLEKCQNFWRANLQYNILRAA